MLGKLPFVLGYGVYCQNGGSEKIFFQFLTSCKKCLDAGNVSFSRLHEFKADSLPPLTVPQLKAINMWESLLLKPRFLIWQKMMKISTTPSYVKIPMTITNLGGKWGQMLFQSSTSCEFNFQSKHWESPKPGQCNCTKKPKTARRPFKPTSSTNWQHTKEVNCHRLH